jgi:hypothetical protein
LEKNIGLALLQNLQKIWLDPRLPRRQKLLKSGSNISDEACMKGPRLEFSMGDSLSVPRKSDEKPTSKPGEWKNALF